MSEWELQEHDGVSDTTPEQRRRAQITVARQMLKEHDGICAAALNDTEELLAMLGILDNPERLSYRTKPRDCGPILRPMNRIKSGNRHRH